MHTPIWLQTTVFHIDPYQFNTIENNLTDHPRENILDLSTVSSITLLIQQDKYSDHNNLLSFVYWHWDIFFKNHNFFLVPFIPTPSHLPLLPFSILCCPSLLPPLLTSLLYFFSPLFPFSSPTSTPSPAIFFHSPLLSFPFLPLSSPLLPFSFTQVNTDSRRTVWDGPEQQEGNDQRRESCRKSGKRIR